MEKVDNTLIVKEKNIDSKSNKHFAILSAIGIIMVVSAHVNSSVDFFNNVFSYNSFFMPMFMFISGYFFKDKNVENLNNTKKYIKKKFINLLLYYFIWNFIYGIIKKVLYHLGLCNHTVSLNFKTLFIYPFIDGQQFEFNNPAWFIPVLFMVEMTFLIIRKLQLSLKHNSEYIFTGITLIISIISVYVAKNLKINNFTILLLPFLKLSFFLFFFQLGKLYNDKLEEKEVKIKNIYVICITVIINIICIKLYKNIDFISLYNMGGFKNLPPYIPIITSITGIWFWLRISRILTPVMSQSKIINKISNNTKSIMMHHVFCIAIINIVLYLFRNIFNLTGFNVTKFKNSPGWYRYYADCPQIGIIYIVLGISGALIIGNIEERIRLKLIKKEKNT